MHLKAVVTGIAAPLKPTAIQQDAIDQHEQIGEPEWKTTRLNGWTCVYRCQRSYETHWGISDRLRPVTR